jgi:death-on-curing protein
MVDVIGLHAEVLERTGRGPQPLVREGALESAVRRPQNAAYYEGADLIRQATLLLVGISQAQAWLDGNKRTAYACATVFLILNGHEYTGDPLELAKRLEEVASRTGSLEEAERQLEQWLRGRVSRVR